MSISEDDFFTSQNTQNITQKNSNKKEDYKDIINLSNQISADEEIIRNKLINTTNGIEEPLKQKINSNDTNLNEKKKNVILSLSPIKKGVRKRNMLVDIMEKSKRMNETKKSVVFMTQELKTNEDDIKHERKDAYGVPINKKNKKKIRVTFCDNINKNKKKEFAEIIQIASFKKYNYVEGLPKEEYKITDKSTCKCCLII